MVLHPYFQSKIRLYFRWTLEMKLYLFPFISFHFSVLLSAIYMEMLVTLLWSEGTPRDISRGGHVNPFIISPSRSIFQRKICYLIFHTLAGLPKKKEETTLSLELFSDSGASRTELEGVRSIVFS